VWRIDVGGNSTNSTLSNPTYGNITAVRGGAGGEGFPPDPLPPIPQIFGKWGGSGGGGGSGGSGTPWICQQGVGGENVTGQGFNGSPAFGGYALAIGGGGGGAGGPGNGGTCGESGGAGFVDTNFLFQTYEFAHGGNGESATLNPCFTTFGSGGRAWWHDYYGPVCVPGNDGVIIIQMCYPQQAYWNVTAQPPKIVMFRVLTHDGKELPNAQVSIQGISTTAGNWNWLQTLLMIPISEAPIQNTFMQGTTDSLGDIEFMMIPTIKYNVTTTLSGYNFSPMYVYVQDERYDIFALPPPVINTTTNITLTPTPTPVPIQTPLSGTFQSSILMYAGVGLLAFSTMLASWFNARHVAIVMCIEAWMFLSFGWFSPIVNSMGIVTVGGLFALATVMAVLWNLKEGFSRELGRL
jgi:hypothetical protein